MDCTWYLIVLGHERAPFCKSLITPHKIFVRFNCPDDKMTKKQIYKLSKVQWPRVYLSLENSLSFLRISWIWLIKWEQFSLSTTQLPIIILENGLTIFQDWEFCFFLHFRPCGPTFIPKNASILEHKGVGFKFIFGLCPFESGIFLVQAFLNSIIGQSDLIWLICYSSVIYYS